MLEIAIIVLAVNALVWWVIVAIWILKPERVVRQPHFVLQEKPGAWTCLDSKCAVRGFVTVSISDRPVCVHCGLPLIRVGGWREEGSQP